MSGPPQGRVFDIQRMSLHDGPGIRTTVFFKGCNLRCPWCHNPESWSAGPEIQFFSARCIGCGACVDACPTGALCSSADAASPKIDRGLCTACGACARACPSGALALAGRDWDVEALVAEVLRDKVFFDHSGGGVTASGGEPLLQRDFLPAFFTRLKRRRVHTCIETALDVPFPVVEALAPVTDLFLADLKHPCDAAHKAYTGVGNARILENIRRLDESGAAYQIRVPVIPGVNDDEQTMAEMGVFLSTLGRHTTVELMPYHGYGVGKLAALGQNALFHEGLGPPGPKKLTALARAVGFGRVVFRQGPKLVCVQNGEDC